MNKRLTVFTKRLLDVMYYAMMVGIVTISLGMPAASLCEHAIVVPSSEPARVQESHITIGHAILELVEDRLTARA